METLDPEELVDRKVADVSKPDAGMTQNSAMKAGGKFGSVNRRQIIPV